MAEPDPGRPMRDTDRAQLEAFASGIGAPNRDLAGRAKYELLLRDREHAEEQEKSHRDFETALTDKQLRAATDVARATWAMWAAGAIVQAAMAVASYLR